MEAGYALAICLGLRRGEIVGLTWNDVDLSERTVHIRWSRTEWHSGTRLVAPKTTASRRVLAMPDIVYKALRDQLVREERKAEAANSTVRPGMPPMRLHDLRHTAASLMLSQGASPRTVMEIMGHRNLDVTMFIYGHTNLRHKREAAQLVDDALSPREGS